MQHEQDPGWQFLRKRYSINHLIKPSNYRHLARANDSGAIRAIRFEEELLGSG
jgi:hypothetical protein